MKTKKIKYSIVLFSPSLVPSLSAFVQFSRIPDVMFRIIKARRVLKNNHIPVPLWMYGLYGRQKKGDTWSIQKNAMSFLCTLAFYDRLIRRYGEPNFLIGSSLACAVSARTRTFENSLIKIFKGQNENGEAVSVYKRKFVYNSYKFTRSSVLGFSKSVNYSIIFQNLKQGYKWEKGALISADPDENLSHFLRSSSSAVSPFLKKSFQFDNFGSFSQPAVY